VAESYLTLRWITLAAFLKVDSGGKIQSREMNRKAVAVIWTEMMVAWASVVQGWK